MLTLQGQKNKTKQNKKIWILGKENVRIQLGVKPWDNQSIDFYSENTRCLTGVYEYTMSTSDSQWITVIHHGHFQSLTIPQSTHTFHHGVRLEKNVYFSKCAPRCYEEKYQVKARENNNSLDYNWMAKPYVFTVRTHPATSIRNSISQNAKSTPTHTSHYYRSSSPAYEKDTTFQSFSLIYFSMWWSR